jgi:hypothetical protein
LPEVVTYFNLILSILTWVAFSWKPYPMRADDVGATSTSGTMAVSFTLTDPHIPIIDNATSSGQFADVTEA